MFLLTPFRDRRRAPRLRPSRRPRRALFGGERREPLLCSRFERDACMRPTRAASCSGVSRDSRSRPPPFLFRNPFARPRFPADRISPRRCHHVSPSRPSERGSNDRSSRAARRHGSESIAAWSHPAICPSRRDWPRMRSLVVGLLPFSLTRAPRSLMPDPCRTWHPCRPTSARTAPYFERHLPAALRTPTEAQARPTSRLAHARPGARREPLCRAKSAATIHVAR